MTSKDYLSQLRLNGKTCWLHTASTDSYTHLTIHKKRGKEAMDDQGILPGFQGIAVHDGYASYFGYDCDHALCNAHLLRELTGIHEDTGQAWAQGMIRLLVTMKDTKQRYIDDGKERLSPYYRKRFHEAYTKLLDQGYALNPPPERLPGQRGRLKHTPARCLLDRLAKYRSEVCRFAE